MSWMSKFFGCILMNMHKWTSASEEGIPATQEQLDAGAEGFFDYAKMYCKDCGEESNLNRK